MLNFRLCFATKKEILDLQEGISSKETKSEQTQVAPSKKPTCKKISTKTTKHWEEAKSFKKEVTRQG